MKTTTSLFKITSIVEIFRRTIFLSIVFLCTITFLNAQTTYTTSQTVVAPTSGSVIIECWGAGGGSGGASNSSGDAVGGGGGGGAYSKQTFPVTAGDNLVLTIGNGGTAGSSGGGNGGTGGTTSVAAPFFTSALGGAGGQGSTCCTGAGGAGGNGGTGFLYRGGNGASGTIAATNRGGGGGGGAGTGSNGNNAPAGGNGATAVAGGVAGAAGGNGGCCSGATGIAGPANGGGAGGATVYTVCCRAGAVGGKGKIILTFNACTSPSAPSAISGATVPCTGASEVYSVTSTNATSFAWTLPAGWTITSGAGTGTITALVGVGAGSISVTPSNGCGSTSPQTLAVTICIAAAPQTINYIVPGTYNWTVPATAGCASIVLTVQAWGGGGGGGGAASNQNASGNEACSEGGGGGGGGYSTRSYTVTSGQTYTIIVGAGGTAGLGSSASAAACNGGTGGNSTFNGPATVGPGTLTAYGGAGGGGALTNNTSGSSHLGSNGAGGAGGNSANGTVTYTGGNGSAGEHSGSCYDVSGAGGGGAGTGANGNNGSTVSGCALKTGGNGGAASGGNGANGGKLTSYTASREYTAGLAGTTIGAGGGGAMIHLNSWPNTWTTAIGGAGARGEVRLSAAISTCVLPIELTSFTGKCENNQTVIEWITATEINNDYFTIEQSKDGINFNETKKIQGAGNSNINKYYRTGLYSSNDFDYFRLKQTDFDGQFSYSESVYVECMRKINTASIFPNPATDEITLQYDFKNNKEVVGYIMNVLGEHVKNFSNNTDSDLMKISITDLPVGMYNIVLVSERLGELLSSTKFIKR